MQDLLDTVLPVFGLLILGWLGGKLRYLPQRVGDGLTDYVFQVAVPVLIIDTLARAELPPVNPWGYWVAYFAGAGITWLVGGLGAFYLFRRTSQEASMIGFTCSQSNTVFIGVPLILRAYGSEGAVPLFLLLAIHLPLMMGVATLLLESGAVSEGGNAWMRLAKVGRVILTHPIVVGLVIGLVLQLSGIHPTGLPEILMKQISATASPCALIAMGLALARHGFFQDFTAALAISTLKLLLHPFLVWVLAFHVLSMPPAWAGVATLFAALPSGINGYLIASRYGVGVKTISSSVALSTGLAIFSVTLWLMVLGVGK